MRVIHSPRLSTIALAVLALAAPAPANADDWGAYSIVPASATAFVLEARGPGTTVSIGEPADAATQKWIIKPVGQNLYTIRTEAHADLVMSAANGASKPGAAITLEPDRGQSWQKWSLQKNDDGSYCIVPSHAPTMGLDHFGGKAEPGARIDLWTNQKGDTHLRWLIKSLAGTQAADAETRPRPRRYVFPKLKPESIPRGVVKHFTFAQSTIYPGTTRQGSVFIPAQYDASKPACVYVKFDGFNAIEPNLLETLIAAGQMPVTVGVFIRPGDLPAPMPNTLGRRNRCLEYDGVGDANARFLIDELLPFVAREFNLKLSTSGNDRCIAGGSSGGITAWNAAWERPDAFSRVYANSGSFVAFRGGHEFPTLVRKFEPRPIRAYLTTGTRDMENCAGDWFLLDQEFEKALRFSGYDYVFKIINGGHVAGYYDHFPEAMSTIWKDWPRPVEPGPGAPRVRDVILPGEGWQPLEFTGKNVRDAATGPTGDVLFVDAGDNSIHRVDVGGKVARLIPDAAAEGLAFDANGTLYTVSSRTGKVMRYDDAGRPGVLADGIPGSRVIATASGGLYVTTNRAGDAHGGEVWFLKDGRKTRVDAGLKHATGLAIRPDQWLISVADGGSKWVYSYQLMPDGTLASKERFFWLHVPDWEDDAGAEAVCYAREGQMLVATRLGIQICADDGPTQVILPLPDRSRPVGICLGGREMDTLYAFTATKIWMRKVKIHGVGAFTPWTPVRGTPL